MTGKQPKVDGGVLMLGSVPLADTSAVFTRISSTLPGRFRSLPDGETGERDYFVRWQLLNFPPEVRTAPSDLPETVRAAESNESNRIAGTKYTVESLGPSRYDDAALASYAKFIELRKQGVIPEGVRFQVCLPTPFGVSFMFCKPGFLSEIEPLYEERFRQSLQRIVENIPHQDLLIQWDLPFETLIVEYDRGAFTFPPWKVSFEPVMEGLLERLVRINHVIPTSVPIGFHLCYGDIDHKHIYEPKDTSLMVELTHHLIKSLGSTHRVEYVHMPVPIDRTDVEYFQPLRDLQLEEHTLLCLGLVHAHDEAGTDKRIEAAKSVYPQSFAVSTECGLGRTPAKDIDSIFHILQTVTEPTY